MSGANNRDFDMYDGFLLYTNYIIPQMSNRLAVLNEAVKKSNPIVESAFQYLQLSSFLTQQENDVRLRVKKFVDQKLSNAIIPYVQAAKFPTQLIPLFQELDVGKYFVPKPYGEGSRNVLKGVILAELARGDAGVATIYVVNFSLFGKTIQLLGSQAQKAQILPKIASLNMIGAWGLTEDKIGSDASNLTSSTVKNENGYVLNGTKRWIGNGNRDYLAIWARNKDNKNVECYVLQNKKTKGLTSEVIKNKIGLRVVENCHITLNNVQVNESQRLPKAINFEKGTNQILKSSRIFVCWIAAGICLGVYDNAIKYTSERQQFGRSISGFQLIQEKLVRIMATTQAILLLCFRITLLSEDQKANIGQIAMAKAWITERGRQVCRLGRQVCGGNGLLHENYVMRAVADMEAVYTYEGTYEINSLVAGRQLTGLAAFYK